MGEFLRNFFDNGYGDNLGEGMFGHRHLIYVLVTAILLFALYFLFKKYKRAGVIFIKSLSAGIFLFRLSITVHRLAVGLYEPRLTALPWHMCSLLAFLLPVVIIFDLKKFKTAIYSASIMGGVVTLALADYFYHRFITIYLWESMLTHSFMIIMPLIEVATGRFKFELKNSWQAALGMLFFLGWATLANDVLFKKYGFNYMYIKYNALPFEVPGVHFFVIYVLIYALFFAAMFGLPELYRRLKARTYTKSKKAFASSD